jgi:hypothetical protein
MIEAGDRANFIVESPSDFGVQRYGIRDDFDRDRKPGAGVAGQPHLTHSAAADGAI